LSSTLFSVQSAPRQKSELGLVSGWVDARTNDRGWVDARTNDRGWIDARTNDRGWVDASTNDRGSADDSSTNGRNPPIVFFEKIGLL
jgi:hypothetical protein